MKTHAPESGPRPIQAQQLQSERSATPPDAYVVGHEPVREEDPSIAHVLAERAATNPLGAIAVRLHDRQLKAEATAEALQQQDDRVQSIIDKDAFDPRFESRLKRGVLRALGKKALSAADVAVLDEAGAASTKLYKDSGWQRNAAEPHRQEAETTKEALEISLDYTRSEFRQFDEMQSRSLDRLLESNPQFPAELKELKPEDQSWSQWLSSKEGADDNQLIKILRWHTDYTEAVNGDQESSERYRDLIRADYRLAVQDAVKKGALPEQALEKLQSLDSVKIQFASLFDAARFRQTDYHLDGTVNLLSTDDTHIANHELTHAVLGSLSREDPMGRRWLNEAATEYINRILQGEDPSQIYDPEDDSDIYPREREYLQTIIDASNGMVTPQDIVEAYLAGEAGYQALEQKIEQAFGSNILGDTADSVKKIYELKHMTSKTGGMFEGMALQIRSNQLRNQYIKDREIKSETESAASPRPEMSGAAMANLLGKLIEKTGYIPNFTVRKAIRRPERPLTPEEEARQIAKNWVDERLPASLKGEELKSTYKKIARQIHPDVVANNSVEGLTPDQAGEAIRYLNHKRGTLS